MGAEEWEEGKFQKWLKLRDDFRFAKKEKNYKKIISIGKSIIDLDSQAKFIGILVPLFEKEIVKAQKKLTE
jgi:hypothetical protein